MENSEAGAGMKCLSWRMEEEASQGHAELLRGHKRASWVWN